MGDFNTVRDPIEVRSLGRTVEKDRHIEEFY